MEMERGKKRKRNLDLPRITYHTSDRTFERLFKEESLGEMEAVVRSKLGLPENSPICLAQLREGKLIDLEDDDDFNAFYSIAHSVSSVNVRVTVAADATLSSFALVQAKRKTKAKMVSAVNTSIELTPYVAANVQIVIEDEGTEKETDTRKRTGGDSDIVEGTSKPRKKRKKDKSESNAVSETPCDPVPSSSNIVGLGSERVGASPVPVANKIASKETSISVSRASTTSDQSTGISRNARRKKKLKDSQVLLEPPTSIYSPPTTGSNSATNENSPKPQRVPFAEQLADIISETSEHNRKHLGKLRKTRTGRKGEKHKDSSSVENTVIISKRAPDAIRGTLLRQRLSVNNLNDGKGVRSNENELTPEDDDIGSRKKKANGKSRASTADELEAANADVKAAFSRILAAKRASLSSSLADNSPGQHSDEVVTTLNGKSDASYYPVVLSDLSSSKAVVAEGGLNGHIGVSNLTTSRSSSRSSENVSEDQNRLGSTAFPIVPADALLHTDVDLDAIIRGPKVSVDAVGDVPSTASSEDGQDLDLAEDDEEIQTSRRARRVAASDSSEADTHDDDDDNSSMDDNRDADHVSFQSVDRLGESQEVDNSDGGVGFHTTLAADTGILDVADYNDATPSVQDNVHDNAENHETIVPFSEGGTCSPRPTRNTSQTVIPSPSRSLTDETDISLLERGSGPKQRGEGIIRRMKGRSGKISEKDSTAGTSTKYNKQPGEFEPDSSTAISVDENDQKRTGRGISQPIQQQVNETVEPGAKAFSQKSMSLDTWTTIKGSSPLPDAESTIMIDELRSSSPCPHSQTNTGNSNLNPRSTKDDPLFILTESQPPFPYSQWRNSPENHRASNDTEDEQEVHASIQSRSQPKTIQPPKYRRLTDIASQHAFFSTSTPKMRPTHSSSNKLADMYGRLGGEEIESDSDTESDSDSDVQVDSHIPKSRIAGVSR